jgi:hypothetical protein
MTASDQSAHHRSSEFERNVRRMRNEWAAEQARLERTRKHPGDADRAFVVPFFCECESVHCHAVVWLTYERYDQLRAMPSSSVLAPGHAASLPAAA